jgi:hypothetical protein
VLGSEKMDYDTSSCSGSCLLMPPIQYPSHGAMHFQTSILSIRRRLCMSTYSRRRSTHPGPICSAGHSRSRRRWDDIDVGCSGLWEDSGGRTLPFSFFLSNNIPNPFSSKLHALHRLGDKSPSPSGSCLHGAAVAVAWRWCRN